MSSHPYLACTALALLLSAGATAQERPDVSSLPDPTQPPSYFAAALDPSSPDSPEGSRVTLSAIVMNHETRFAIVNGRRLEVGDTLGEATVNEIRATSVVLSYPDRELELRFSRMDVKTPAGDVGGRP